MRSAEAQAAARDESQTRKEYADARMAFGRLITQAERVSIGASGIASPTAQHYWASVLFTRMTVTAKSIQLLAPAWSSTAHWDFSAVASIARNLAECYLFFFFLCIDDVPKVEKDARIILLNLHDDGTRGRLMGEMSPDPPNEEIDRMRAAVRDDLLAKFRANAWLAGLPPKRQNELIKGEKTPFVQDDVIERTTLDKASFRLLYRLFSAHTHSGPISFYRMAEHGRGHGVANDHDARYLTTAVGFAANLMERATADFLQLFPDADARGGKLLHEQRRAGKRRR